jgi:hypothetical protein
MAVSLAVVTNWSMDLHRATMEEETTNVDKRVNAKLWDDMAGKSESWGTCHRNTVFHRDIS